MNMVNTNLTGVPETIRWTPHHHQAAEALRSDAWFPDDHAVRTEGKVS